MPDQRRGSCLGRALKIGALVIGGLLAALAAALGVWAIVNVPPPSAPVLRDHLTSRDLDLVRESQHLRASLGGRMWPGFQDAAIPVQLYNDRFGFVLGMEPAPPGWEEVTANRYGGAAYYRTAHPETQAFAVRVGDRWAGSMTVKDAADAGMPRLLRQKIGVLARLVPYRVFIPSTDQYVGLVLHEQFHAFEAERNSRRFERALGAYAAQGRYPWSEPRFADAWMEEMALLQAALAATDRATRSSSAARFLASRQARRERLRADAGAFAFERDVEWLEGLGKYVELATSRLAGGPGYSPLPAVLGDPQFHGYRDYASLWQRERMSLRFRANLHDDLPFYMSGAMQAMLLDELDPGWKAGFLESDRSLDERLGEAVGQERR